MPDSSSEFFTMVLAARSDLISNSLNSSQDSSAAVPGVHERANLPTSTLPSVAGESSGAAQTVTDDAQKQMPPQNDPSRRGRSRRSRSNPPQRVPHSSRLESVPHSSPLDTRSDYPTLAHTILENENVRDQPPASFIPQPRHFPPTAVLPYDQRFDYSGQYSMPTLPDSMNIPHPPPSYAFPPYHQIPQGMHASYQTMLQPHTPVFPYGRSAAEGGPRPHRSFSNAPSPTAYAPHPSSTPQTTHHLTSSSSQGGSLYANSGPFHSLQYPSTMVVPAYNYPPQTYPSSQMYQPSYPAPTFSQQFPSQGERDPNLAWYYFPPLSSGPSPQFRDPSLPFQSHYAVGYSQGGHSGLDSSFTSDVAHGGPPENYSSQYHDGRSDDSLPPPGPVPLQHSHPVEEMLGAIHMESGLPATSDRPLIRRSFHPNPPAHRSDWVMWVGNVPADATHDEIWQFFITAPVDGVQQGSTNGVVSVFLISRSNCAFINYQSMEYLHQAITRFNGVPLRANDLRCPRLVCRARKTDDDLKAGVGYQRGMGMHTRWVKEQKLSEVVLPQNPQSAAPDGTPSSPGSPSESMAGPLSNVSPASDDDVGKGPNPPHSSSSDSYSSTNSSFLARYFPIRYFILKSLSQEDLDTSVSRGVWATQKHNEEILDQAFRTSKEVYLIFGVNKSREFYGYARMIGPVHRGQSDVQWAIRPSHQSTGGSQISLPILASQVSSHPDTFFSPSDHRFVDKSPLTIGGSASTAPSTGEGNVPGLTHVHHSAPALLGEEYRKHSLLSPTAKPHSVDQQHLHLNRGRTERFALDASAPVRAIRGHEDAPGKDEPHVSTSMLDLVYEEDIDNPEAEEETNDLTTPVIQPGEDVQRGEVLSWGDNFAVEWLCRERLSFNKTKHLRNPWNRDREIKVSRDGTELEPTVGQQLLQDWHRIAESQPSPAGAPGKTPISTSGRRGTSTKPEWPFPIVGGGDRLLNVASSSQS